MEWGLGDRSVHIRANGGRGYEARDSCERSCHIIHVLAFGGGAPFLYALKRVRTHVPTPGHAYEVQPVTVQDTSHDMPVEPHLRAILDFSM